MLVPALLLVLAAEVTETAPRLPTVETVERIPLQRASKSVSLTVYPFNRRIELRSRDSAALAAKIAAAGSRLCPRTHNPIDELTTREREVLALVGSGLSNAEIGGRLGLAEKTVKHYMTSILGKLGVASRVEAALLAYKAGLVPGEPPPEE